MGGDLSYVPVAFGFLSGGALIQGTDKLLDYLKGSLEELDLYKGMAVGDGQAASRQQRVRRLLLLIIAITIHNFPEGMAVGVGFGAMGSSPGAPIGGVLGAAFVQYCRPLLPFTMSLAAGAMIFVVADSLIPEMTQHGNKALAMQGLMLGFVLMMVLDVALG